MSAMIQQIVAKRSNTCGWRQTKKVGRWPSLKALTAARDPAGDARP
jgi:hypothetical protein